MIELGNSCKQLEVPKTQGEIITGSDHSPVVVIIL